MTRTGSDAVAASVPPMGQPSPPPSARDAPPCRPSAATSPILAVDGFEGPLDWLLALAHARKVDLARLSILALVEAFAEAMEAALSRAPDAPAPDLAQWAAWTVMAAQLAELRSRLLRPADAPDARTAQAEAEALRRQWLRRADMMEAADWLERRPQLGRDVFARGRPEAGWAGQGGGTALGIAPSHPADEAGHGWAGEADASTGQAPDPPPVDGGDLTDLLRACLAALRLPPRAEAYQPRRLPFWSVGDAAARIGRLLQKWREGGQLGAFLPRVAEADPARRSLHGRAAVAATLVAGLELARSGSVILHQDAPWQPIQVQRRGDGSPDRTAKSATDEHAPSLA